MSHHARPIARHRAPAGSVIEVGLPNYREAMVVARTLPFVRSVEVSGDHLRVLVAREDECENAEGKLRTALTEAGFTVELMRPAATDLEMAFATLIPSADEYRASVDEDILAVSE